MRLKPIDILNHLGFNVPEEGIVINGDDAFLYSHSLSLLGNTMDPDRIPPDDLILFQRTLFAMVGKGSEPNTYPSSEDPSKVLDLIKTVHETFSRKV